MSYQFTPKITCLLKKEDSDFSVLSYEKVHHVVLDVKCIAAYQLTLTETNFVCLFENAVLFLLGA